MSTMPYTTVSFGGPREPSRLQQILGAFSRRLAAAHQRLIVREELRELRELDESMLRDIGASGDQIYRLYQLRNGDRPTLAVG